MNRYRILIVVMVVFMMALLASCGHNMAVYSKGVGLELSWRPNTVLPSLRVGSFENLDTAVRENNHVRYSSNVGVDAFGRLLSVLGLKSQSEFGNGTVLEIKTGPQMNGYLRDIVSGDITKEKASVIESVCSVKSKLDDRETRLTNGSVSANAEPVVVTEKGAFGSSTVTTPVDEITKDAIVEQVNPTSVIDLLERSVKYVVLGIVALAVLLVAGGLVYMSRTGKKLSDLAKTVKDLSKKD